MNALEDIMDRTHVYPIINARYSRLIICDQIRRVKSKRKGADLSAKRVGKGLHEFFKIVVKDLKNSLSDLVELDSEVSHFIPEPSNFVEVTRLPAEVKKA